MSRLNQKNKFKGFSLVELLLVVAVLVIVLTTIMVILGADKRKAQAQDAKRWSDVRAVLSAVNSKTVDSDSPMCANLGTELPKDNARHCLGTGSGTEDIPPDPVNGKTVVCKIRVSCPANTCYDAALNSMPTDCCCTSLSSWESARDGNLTTRTSGSLVGTIEVAQIEGNWTSASTGFEISGWTTNVSHYIKIFTTPEARHNGVWDDTKHRIVVAGNPISGGTAAFIINSSDVKIEGLQISSGGWGFLVRSNCNRVELSNNIIKKNQMLPGDEAWKSGIKSYGEVKIWNNLIYGYNNSAGDSDCGIQQEDSTSYIYNNTIVNSSDVIPGMGHGIQTDNDGLGVVATNNLIYNYQSAYEGVFLPGTDYNATNSDETPGPGLHNMTNIADPFMDLNNNDYRLKPGASVIDRGLDLTEDTNLSFSDDIETGFRNFVGNLGWDIGADEYEVGVCCDLAEDLVGDGYLKEMPQDPTEGDLEGTGNSEYYIRKNSNTGLVSVSAPHQSEYTDQNKKIIVGE